MKYLIALDQGTTSSRAIIFDEKLNTVSSAQREFKQIFPQPGYVEHDPEEIFSSQYEVMSEALEMSGIMAADVAAIGVTNQRETTIMWDKKTGKPVYNAIVWQCRRTAPYCEEITARGFDAYIKESTGLVIDAYFSATKIMWILDNVPGVRERAEAGDILFGTVDSWLIWRLTNGRAHVTDHTNASRTMLYNINTRTWDSHILNELNIPAAILPKIVNSSGACAVVEISGREIPISGIAGDQQAALFGQHCFSKGDVKNTYGTGCFLLMNTGDSIVKSDSGLIATVAAGQGEEIVYALEGSIFTAGSVIQWLRDELGLISSAAQSEQCALRAGDNAGVYVVPAFTGLGAPYWDMNARGSILGLTRGANSDHIIRAALEAIAYQTKDVLDAMQKDTGVVLKELKTDGGASENSFLMQFQSDILNIDVVRPETSEATALGAAYLAGLATGVWKNTDELKERRGSERRFTPSIDAVSREKLLRGWMNAVAKTRYCYA